MITEKDLREAIAECQGVRNPNANTCIKLAAYLTIQREMFGETPLPEPTKLAAYSLSPGPNNSYVQYTSDTEFSKVIDGRDQNKIWPIMDELMTVLQATNYRLYNGVMEKLNK